EATFERAHAVLGAHDAVDLDEHGGLRRIGGVLGRGRTREREPSLLAREDERPVVRAHLAQGVAKTGVDRETSFRQATLECLVVDGERGVMGGDGAAPKSLVEPQPMAGGLVSRAAEPTAACLALELGERAKGEVQNLDRMPGAERLAPRPPPRG